MRRHGQFDACEDAVQEALLAAAVQWPADGVPDRPGSWLLTVAGRSLIDQWRSDSARRRRERAAALDPAGHAPAADHPGAGHRPADADDTLVLLFLCCHPALSPPSQLALTLRAVGGLTTGEIAAAFLVPEATIAKRISRAKQYIHNAGTRFELPPPDERAERLGVVLHVLYLVFNEGYTTSSGPALHRADLTTEAIRLRGRSEDSVFRRPRHSAAASNDPLGFVVVTHPFHPLNGRRLEVLFVKRRGDAVVFVCSGGVGGQMTLPLAWTDRGDPPAAHRLWAQGLAALDTLAKMLENE